MLPGKSYAFDDVVALLKRGKWLIVMPLVLAGLATVVALHFTPNRYRSETLVLVVPQRVPESYVKATVTTKIDDRLESISQQILTRTRLERIITDFDLYARERQVGLLEDVVVEMRADIKVQMVKSDAFRVSYVATDANVAYKVTERLASLLIEENLRDREVLAEATDQFLETQLEDARTRLVGQELQLEQYRLRYAGQLPSEVPANLQVVQNTQLQILALVDSINRDRDRRLVLERAVVAAESQAQSDRAAAAAVPDATPVAVRPSATAGQLEAARQTLQELESRLTPLHPNVARQRRTIVELEGKLRAEESMPGSPGAGAGPGTGAPVALIRSDRIAIGKIDDLKSEVAALDRQLAAKEQKQQLLETQVSAYQARVSGVPVRESELVSLTRDYETLRRVYQDLLTKHEESKVAANLERRQIGEQFKILDPARASERPFSPRRPRVLALGLAAGLAIGLMLIGWREYRDSSMRTEDDVMATVALPVMAIVPMMTTRGNRRRRVVRTLVLSSIAASMVIVAIVLAMQAPHLI